MFFPSNSCNELMAFDHILREANAPPMLVSKVQCISIQKIWGALHPSF